MQWLQFEIFAGKVIGQRQSIIEGSLVYESMRECTLEVQFFLIHLFEIDQSETTKNYS